MAAATIWKITKTTISPQRFDWSLRNLVCWCKMGLLTAPTVKNFKFHKSKMGDGGHFKNRHIAISLQPFGRFWWNLAWCHYSGQVVKISNFWKFKMVAAAMLKITKIAISPQRFDLGMLKFENFFSRYQKFFSRDSTRILDHVMIMSHLWRHLM